MDKTSSGSNAWDLKTDCHRIPHSVYCSDFVRKIKLNIALHLLENGYNVSEVAFKTGFSDVKYFSRLFKIQFGYSPSKHRLDL